MNFLKDREGYFFTNKALVKLIIPLIVEQFLAVLVGLADSIMVASVGEAAVSGVSLVDTIFILLINVFAALATGGAVVCGQFLGRKKKKGGLRSGRSASFVYNCIFRGDYASGLCVPSVYPERSIWQD